MSFLELNGYPIPAIGGQMKYLEFGSRRPAYDGTARAAIRKRKREWSFGTTPLTLQDYQLIKTLILGGGQLWQLDNGLWSSKGLRPDGGGNAVIMPRLAVDGNEVMDGVTANPQGLYGDGVASFDNDSRQDLLTDTATAEAAPSGYVPVNGAALSADTGIVYQGTKSLKCVTPGSSGGKEGLFTGGGSSSQPNGTELWGSVYLKGTTKQLEVYIRDFTNGAEGTHVLVNLPETDKWYRVTCTHTISGATATVWALYVVATDDSVATTWYSDAFQVEPADHPHAWVDAGGDHEADFQVTTLDWIDGPDLTFGCWTRGPDPTVVGAVAIAVANIDVNHKFELSTTYGGNLQIALQNTDASSAYTWLYSSGSLWDGSWRHIVATATLNPADGSTYAQLYVDGSLVGAVGISIGSQPMPRADTFTELNIGAATYGPLTLPLEGAMDDVLVLPFAAPASMVAALFAQGAHSRLSTMFATGDFTEDEQVLVKGQLRAGRYFPYSDSNGNWLNNPRTLTFRLTEV